QVGSALSAASVFVVGPGVSGVVSSDSEQPAEGNATRAVSDVSTVQDRVSFMVVSQGREGMAQPEARSVPPLAQFTQALEIAYFPWVCRPVVPTKCATCLSRDHAVTAMEWARRAEV